MLYAIPSKRNLILDFDSTMVDSVKAFCDVYNSVYFKHPDFKEANPLNVRKWNLEDECPLSKDNVLHIFEQDSFYNFLEFFPNAIDVMMELSEKYNLAVCSVGTPLNIAKKTMFIAERTPFIKNQIMLVKDKSIVGKSVVNMEGAIFVDDVAENLVSTNALIKVAYGVEKPWNEQWQGLWVKDWEDIREKFL